MDARASGGAAKVAGRQGGGRETHHLGEELLVARDELRRERGGGALLEHVPSRVRVHRLIQVHRKLIEPRDGQHDGLAVRLDDNLRVDALLDVRLGLAQKLAGE